MFRRKRVNFLVIGAQKSGTSSFYQYLTFNQMISPAKVKEVHYFDHFYHQGVKWYHSNFEFRRNHITGEASPYYLLHPDAPKRAYAYNPEMQIIAILRNPVERAISHYKMNLQNGAEHLSFTEAINLEEERLSTNFNPDKPDNVFNLFTYKKRGLYADQLQNWQRFFDDDQLMVLNYHQFFEDPWKAIQPIYDFLNVAPHYGTRTNFKENISGSTFDASEEDIASLESYFREPNERLAEQYNIHFE